MSGKSYLVVAAQGGGKTEAVVKMLEDYSLNEDGTIRDNYIYDPFGGYANRRHIKNKAKHIITKKDFLKFVPIKQPSNVNVVFPDASGFIPSTGDLPEDVTNQLCTVFHTKNINLWEYHDLSLFNIKFISFIDYIILGQTTGDPGAVYRKFKNYPRIIAAYKYVQKVTAGTAFDRDKKKFLPGSFVDDNGKTVHRSAAYSAKWYHYQAVIKISR